MYELVLLAPASAVEELSQRLIDELAAQSVSVEDADADGASEQALYGEPGAPPAHTAWPRSRLVGLFRSEDEATAAATRVLAQASDRTVVLDALRRVPDQDWVRHTQSQFAPVAITADFWIVPSWHIAPATATRVLRLDPGLAFGTGTHPTTRMCLRWIAGMAPSHARAWHRVLDYGCGSGVLAIAAALHGARGIDAVDIDAAAIETTRANAAANAVTLSCGLPQLATGSYPLVLANILATPLTLLAPLLCERVAPAGHLVLAGILARQADQLQRAYAPALDLAIADEADGWILMTAQRRA
jgi:ribosomal protein L11 methyltransferase